MPIYEYTCQHCHNEFEEIVLDEKNTVSCPECGSQDVSQLMSGFRHRCGGPIVKGSPSSRAITTRGTSPCASCSGGSCSSCGSS